MKVDGWFVMYFDMLLEEMAKSKGKVKIIHGNIFGISPIIEWIKWLNYEPQFEKKRIEYLNSKVFSELSSYEIDEVYNYKRNKLFAKLFKDYWEDKCSEEDYIKVYNYMCSESIENLMLMKLNHEELEYAKKEITRLSKMSKEQLDAKIKEEIKVENYEQLSMVEAYILHVIIDIVYNRYTTHLNKTIKAQVEQNEFTRLRSLGL